MSSDDARYAQKMAARKDGVVASETYPSNPNPTVQAAAVDEATARYQAKLAARLKAEADVKAAAAAGASEAKAESAPEAKADLAPEEAKADAKGDSRGRR